MNIDISDKYMNVLDSFEADYNLLLNDPYGLTYMNQCIKRIKDGKKLLPNDKKLLNDIDLLRQLNYDLRFGFVKIVIETDYFILSNNKK